MSGLSCEQARNLFDAYLNNELSDDLSTELVAHRVNCASCRHELALLEVAGHVIRSGREEPKPSADFTARLMACIRQQHPAPTPFYRRAKVIWTVGPALAAAACLLFAVTMWPEKPKHAVLEFQEHAKGVVGEPSGAGASARPVIRIDDATADLQVRFRQGASSVRGAVSSLSEAGKRTILETVNAMRPETRDGRKGLQQPLEELLESADDEREETRADEEIEDL